MSPAVFLAQLLALDGVLDAALIGPSGELLEPLREAQLLTPIQAALTTYLSSDRVLAELLGAETPTQTLLEFDSETALLTLSTQLGDRPCRVVTLCEVRDLSGVRSGLERLLPAAAQVSIPS